MAAIILSISPCVISLHLHELTFRAMYNHISIRGNIIESSGLTFYTRLQQWAAFDAVTADAQMNMLWGLWYG